MVGCGTVMEVEDAQRALDAGAQFIVSPILVPEVCAPRDARRA
jgi:2-keto-3-deoxy-6-phosphogluconate aldolase